MFSRVSAPGSEKLEIIWVRGQNIEIFIKNVKFQDLTMLSSRAGFKKAWQERDYATIIAVARKIPEKILQEDPKLLMWYDQALTRTGG